jgi:plastocyanin
MLKKEANIAIIVILVIALAVMGVSVYNIFTKKNVIMQEETAEPVIEEPKNIPGNVVDQAMPEEKEPTVTILIYRYDFDKPEIVIEPGTKVIWKNMDTRQHVILDKRDALQFRTIKKILEYGDTFEYTFNKLGTYEIIEANFGINGRVIVNNKASNLITGNAIRNMEFNSGSFFLVAINLLAVTLALLVLGFYISRNKK